MRLFGVLEEITNTFVISKIESKLPILIFNEWGGIVIEEDLRDKPAKEKFQRFMTFMEFSKEKIEYLTSEVRCRGDVNYVTGIPILDTKHEDMDEAAAELRKLRGIIYKKIRRMKSEKEIRRNVNTYKRTVDKFVDRFGNILTKSEREIWHRKKSRTFQDVLAYCEENKNRSNQGGGDDSSQSHQSFENISEESALDVDELFDSTEAITKKVDELPDVPVGELDTSSDTIDEEIRIRLSKLEVPEEVELVAVANTADEEIENRLLRLKFFRQTWCAKPSQTREVAVRESNALRVEPGLPTPQSRSSSAPALSQPNFLSSSDQNLLQSQPCDCMNVVTTLVEEVRAPKYKQAKDRVQQNSDMAAVNNPNMMGLQRVVLVLVITFLKLLCQPKFKLRLQFVPASHYSISASDPCTTQNVTTTASTTSGNNSVLSSMKRLCGRVQDVVQGVVVDCKVRLGRMLRRNMGTVMNSFAQLMMVCAKKFENAAEKIKPDENE